jgi:hypothetical protein
MSGLLDPQPSLAASSADLAYCRPCNSFHRGTPANTPAGKLGSPHNNVSPCSRRPGRNISVVHFDKANSSGASDNESDEEEKSGDQTRRPPRFLLWLCCCDPDMAKEAVKFWRGGTKSVRSLGKRAKASTARGAAKVHQASSQLLRNISGRGMVPSPAVDEEADAGPAETWSRKLQLAASGGRSVMINDLLEAQWPFISRWFEGVMRESLEPILAPIIPSFRFGQKVTLGTKPAKLTNVQSVQLDERGWDNQDKLVRITGELDFYSDSHIDVDLLLCKA